MYFTTKDVPLWAEPVYALTGDCLAARCRRGWSAVDERLSGELLPGPGGDPQAFDGLGVEC
eukprot:8942952-Heterocapsa_arctica.AAC.1